jgi:hypothetical protein
MRAPVADRLPEPLVRAVALARRRSAIVMFAAGFLFDFFTIGRIDAWVDLAFQLLYLCALTALLLYQHREAQGVWRPPPPLERWWAYNIEALHFLYGGLLSAYVVLYFRSSTGARPLVFFVLLVALMVLNELPQVRRASHRWRLGLYAFCVTSFLNYFVPILAGRMGAWVFAAGLALSGGIVWMVADRLASRDADRLVVRRRLFVPAAVVCLVIGALYALRFIPPVPLSIQFHGIYHDVRREGGAYVLTYEAPPAWRFWRRESRPFSTREGDRLHYFVRVFAPTGFVHEVVVRWEVQDADGDWQTSDRIGMRISGGRAQGFRGFAVKSNFEPGRWRVTTETDDGRAIAMLRFDVREHTGDRPRVWRTRRE